MKNDYPNGDPELIAELYGATHTENPAGNDRDFKRIDNAAENGGSEKAAMPIEPQSFD